MIRASVGGSAAKGLLSKSLSKLSANFVRGLATVNVTINGKPHSFENGEKKSILEACREVGVQIPTLCYHPVLGPDGNCRVCLVENDGWMVPSCKSNLTNGAVINTDTPHIRKAIQKQLELLRRHHPNDCMTCDVNGSCEFQDLINRYRVEEVYPNTTEARVTRPVDESSNSIVRDSEKCIKCGRCIRACSEMQDMGIIGWEGRAGHEVVATVGNLPINQTACISCGQCVVVCPVGALSEKPESFKVLEELEKPVEDRKVMVAHTAPSVRVALGEAFGMDPGSITEGKMVSALKKLGFDYVFDVNFTADLTIVEEANELIQRVQKGGTFPMFTSCCPGWVNMVEKRYPELIDNLSTCRSPMGMISSLVRTKWANSNGLNPEDVHITSIMPCTAKKDEKVRPQLSREYKTADGRVMTLPDTDNVLVTRELARMIKMKNIKFASLEDLEFDNPLGQSTGAAIVFGNTGGVMEAALRTAYEKLTGKTLEKVEFEAVRSDAESCDSPHDVGALREASLKVGDLEVRVAAVSGLNNTQKLLREIAEGKRNYHFVEVMACQGGCINGGGQVKSSIENAVKARAHSIYKMDGDNEIRCSHKNPAILDFYEKHLGEVGGHDAHELLHTYYTDRKDEVKYNQDHWKLPQN
eukprot:GCRY01000252.1.p1 GENE.GCRY01000252.1~~GCRY01000252.1.p1  ORF type:complete len:641 (-),score=157.79 GCRY01000252.1:153-2075(-)